MVGFDFNSNSPFQDYFLPNIEVTANSQKQITVVVPEFEPKTQVKYPERNLQAELLVYFYAGTLEPNAPKTEAFYWLTIMFSQTLGTALGDWTADTQGLGYTGAALIFGSLLLVLVGLHFWTKISKVFLFWAAFVLTRPLGAVLGDFLDKPLDHGGLDLSRFTASFVLLAFIVVCLCVFKSKPASQAH